MFEENGNEGIRRIDISYPKLLLWSVNDCRIAMSDYMSNTERRKSVREFLVELKTLKAMLHPYLNKDLQNLKINTDVLDGGTNRAKTNMEFHRASFIFEKLLDEMHSNNLLLENVKEERV